MSERRAPDLEAAIDDLVASYHGPDEINSLETSALPNKRQVIEAYTHLKSAIFLGFFSHRALDHGNLRYSLSEQIYPAYERLVTQIGRALVYEALFHQRPAPPQFAEGVVLDLIRKLPEIRCVLNSDVLAAFEGDPAAKSIEEVVFSYPVVEAITAYRVAHVLHAAGVPIVPRIISEYAHSKTGVDIHPGARIGQRFFKS
jgi:serine O-acetyltransferase